MKRGTRNGDEKFEDSEIDEWGLPVIFFFEFGASNLKDKTRVSVDGF